MRSRHSDYLEHIADRDSLLVSHALEHVLAEVAPLIRIPPNPKPNRKVELHASISKHWAGYIDRLAVLWGIQRSQVVMRIVDMARERDGAA